MQKVGRSFRYSGSLALYVGRGSGLPLTLALFFGILFK